MVKPPDPPWFRRLYRALGPLAGGFLLDTFDFATFGPLGYGGGFVVGALLGGWVAAMEGFGWTGRLYCAVLAAFYTALPRTELFPLATAIAAASRFLRPGSGARDPEALEASVEGSAEPGETGPEPDAPSRSR